MENVTQPVSLAAPPPVMAAGKMALRFFSVAVRALVYACSPSYSGTLLRNQPTSSQITFSALLANIRLSGDILLLADKARQE